MNISNYPDDLAKQLVTGFTIGFSIHHNGDMNKSDVVSSKVPKHLENILLEKIESEIRKGRMMGPFDRPPFDDFQISPVSVREKSTAGKFRMIHNLSHPYNGSSINSNIRESEKSVKYSNIRDAIAILSNLPTGVYMCKTDIKDAFRIMPIRESDHPKLGMKFMNKYYFDRNLPMGCAMSCKLFESFATALAHIFQFYDPDCFVIHYLDDFLFINVSKELCESSKNLFTTLCEKIGVPLAHDKTTQPDTSTVFLGIELDSLRRCAKLPIDKLKRYDNDIKTILSKRTVTKKCLQSIIGKLSFASSVISARAFLRRIIDLLPLVKNDNHFITLPQDTKLDLITWSHFLRNYNGITFFRSMNIIHSNSLNMQSDASKVAFGAT